MNSHYTVYCIGAKMQVIVLVYLPHQRAVDIVDGC